MVGKGIGKKDKIIELISPYKWYFQAEAAEEKYPELIGAFREENKKIELLPFNQNNGETKVLGASLLNFSIRDNIIDKDELPHNKRYLNPIEFSKNLEISPRGLCRIETRKKKLIELIMRGDKPDYGIDVTNLHEFKFKKVDHTTLEEFEDEEIVRRYRLSGRHEDYSKDIYKRNLQKIRFFAHKYLYLNKENVTIEEEDLINAGSIGLLDALEKYSLRGRSKFKTYAEFRIRGSMLDEFRASGFVPRQAIKRRNKIAEFQKSHLKEFGEEATQKEIMEELKITEGQLAWVMKDGAMISLNAPVNGYTDICLEEKIGMVDYKTNEFKAVDKKERIRILERALSLLPERDQKLIVLYYFKDQTLKKAGRSLGYTESRASQVHDEIMHKLRRVADLEELSH